MPHSTIFQLYHGGQFYLWRKPVYTEKTTNETVLYRQWFAIEVSFKADLTVNNLGYNIHIVDVDFCGTHNRSTRTHDYTMETYFNTKKKQMTKKNFSSVTDSQDKILSLVWLSLCRLTPLSTIFQLYRYG